MCNNTVENFNRKCEIEFKALKTRCSELDRRITSIENVIYQAKEYLTIEEAAEYLGCTKSLLYKMTHLHTIPFYKPSGKMVYFEKSELNKWMTQNRSMSDDEINEQANKIIKTLSTK